MKLNSAQLETFLSTPRKKDGEKEASTYTFLLGHCLKNKEAGHVHFNHWGKWGDQASVLKWPIVI
jgi:hypothetical protein